jgi:hypothetical protein
MDRTENQESPASLVRVGAAADRYWKACSDVHKNIQTLDHVFFLNRV